MTPSNLKFLVDVGVGKKVELLLKEQGYDTRTVRTIDPQMHDEEIVRLAFLEDRMIITFVICYTCMYAAGIKNGCIRSPTPFLLTSSIRIISPFLRLPLCLFESCS